MIVDHIKFIDGNYYVDDVDGRIMQYFDDGESGCFVPEINPEITIYGQEFDDLAPLMKKVNP